MTASNIRIGIDVGGTFTHAVAVDAISLAVLGHTKVPTTHESKAGVAQGVIESLNRLLTDLDISPDKVSFIAHSTTQATNALLEGDVAAVGILGMGNGAIAWLASEQTKLSKISLGHGYFLKTYHCFLDTAKGLDRDRVLKAFASLKEAGAQAYVISEAFSVDNADNENFVLSIAKELGLSATTGNAISKLYGLRTRTRTAALNAAMIPKMLETAGLTEQAVREAGIKAPLMIMRSDGGVMDLKAMRERPILTMLSGPAAGVAAATMFLRISDGIFLEVGGTSTDISAIRNGRARLRYAEIGGHRLHMRTIDVRTVGIAGGSLARSRNKNIIYLGPRSAHIAGLKYAAFVEANDNSCVELISPKTNDPNDYIVLTNNSQNTKLAITTTCAANYLNLVPANDPARGNKQSVTAAFEALGKYLNRKPVECAQKYLELASASCVPILNDFVKAQKLDKHTLTLYGGGGGAAAIVPYLAQKLKHRYELAEKADVISAIGVALALVQETVERQIVKPSQDDILKLRQQAYLAVQQMGAEPSSIQVFVEIDSQTNVVRATASGATSIIDAHGVSKVPPQEDILKTVAESMHVSAQEIKVDLKTAFFTVYRTIENKKRKFWQRKNEALRIVDAKGIIRYQGKQAETVLVKKKDSSSLLAEIINRLSNWGDAGKTSPTIVIFAGAKIIDLSGLIDANQLISVAQAELELFAVEEEIIILSTRN